MILGENCIIPVAFYKILLDGESWYNKYRKTEMGFIKERTVHECIFKI